MLASCVYGFGQHIKNLTRSNRLMTLKVPQKFALTTILRVCCDAGCYSLFGYVIGRWLQPYQLFFVSQAFYKLTMNTTKMSIIMLYLRIFPQRWFRLTCYVLLIIITSYMVAAFFASIFQCTPVARAWDKSIPGSCIDNTTNWYANAGFSIATDFIILALPMYPIY